MKKILYIIGAGLFLIIIAAAVFSWHLMNQPIYQPGNLQNEGVLESSLTPPEADPKADLWQVADDIQLDHFSSGHGQNVLVIHGGPGYPFLKPIQALSGLENEYQFHYYDQRGCGASTRPIDTFASKNYYKNTQLLEKRLGLSAQIADIERIRRILGDEKIILIGHSYGGFLASLYAAEFPEHVGSLVLVAPANVLVMPQDEHDLFDIIRANLPEEDLADYNQFIEEYFNFRDIFEKSESDLVQMQKELGRYYQHVMEGGSAVEQGEPGGWMVWAMYFSTGQRYDYRDALSQVTAPVLVIHGAEDLQSESASRMYADSFANAQFEVVQDAAHFVFEDQPEQFSDLLDSFLSEIKERD